MTADLSDLSDLRPGLGRATRDLPGERIDLADGTMSGLNDLLSASFAKSYAVPLHLAAPDETLNTRFCETYKAFLRACGYLLISRDEVAGIATPGVTGGLTLALTTLNKMAAQEQKRLWVIERGTATYWAARDICAALQIPILSSPCDDQCPDDAGNLLVEIITSPNNPDFGLCAGIAPVAGRMPAFVLVDGIYDFPYARGPHSCNETWLVNCVRHPDMRGVVFFSSLSKIVSLGLRVGCAFFLGREADRLRAMFEEDRYRLLMDISHPVLHLGMALMQTLLADHGIHQHNEAIRHKIQENATLITQLLQRCDAEILGGNQGPFIVIRNSAPVLAALDRLGIEVKHGSHFNNPHILRVNSFVPERVIARLRHLLLS